MTLKYARLCAIASTAIACAGACVAQSLTVAKQHMLNNDPEKALVELDNFISKNPGNEQALDMRAYVLKGLKSPKALTDYQSLLDIAADNKEAYRGLVLGLQTSGQSSSAKMLAKNRPELFTLSEMALLDQAVAILQYRHSAAMSSATDTRASIEKALDQLNKIGIEGLGAKQQRQIVCDKLILLNALGRFEDTVNLGGPLADAGPDELPSYALLELSRAYAELKEYQQSLTLLAPVVSRDPLNLEARELRFRVLADKQQYAVIKKEAAALVEATKKTSDFAYKQALNLEVQVHLYADDMEAASILLEKALALNPVDHSLNVSKGLLYLWQGKYIQALEHYSWLVSVHPDSSEAKSKKAMMLAYLNRPQEALQVSSSSELLTLIQEQAKPRVDIGVSSAQDAVSKTTESKVAVSAAAPLGDTLLAEVSLTKSRSEVTAHTTTKVGLSSTQNGTSVFGGFVKNGVRSGGFVGGYLNFSDKLKLKGEFTSAATDLPLRAIAANISSNKVSGSIEAPLTYQTTLKGSFSRQQFTDKNIRLEGYLGAKWVSTPFDAHRFDISPSFYFGKNSLTNAIYFNPAESSSAEITWGYSFVQPLKSKKFSKLTHRLELTTGMVHQSGFTPDSVLGVGYTLEYTSESGLDYSLTGGLVRRPYDGKEEITRKLAGNLAWKF